MFPIYFNKVTRILNAAYNITILIAYFQRILLHISTHSSFTTPSTNLKDMKYFHNFVLTSPTCATIQPYISYLLFIESPN